MQPQQIIAHCTTRLKMSNDEAQWVASNIYRYAVPDFSEWSSRQINQCFRDVLWFKGKTDADIERALCAS